MMKFIPSTCWLTWMFMSLVFPVSFVYGAQGQLTIKTPRPAVAPTSPVSPRLPEPLVKPVPQPDLTVESLGWSMPVKQGDRIGSSSQLVISVKNKGQVASGPFNIKITVSGASADQSILSGLNGTLPCTALGSKMSRTLKWPEPSAMVWPSGSFSVTAEVDDGSLKINPERANAKRVMRFTVLPSASFLHPAPQITLSPGKTIKPSEKVGINPHTAGSIHSIAH
ncbi:MAG: hypothetical protein KKA41_06450 [Proteobacteria bacterium]|nr:hypothetical protein [Pseudomonadota bacterium]